MILPRTLVGPHGITVEGAGPQLLGELLESYELVLRRESPTIADALRPGLPRAEIIRRLAEKELEPPEELIVWWEWHDGFTHGVPLGLRFAQMSLEDSLRLRQDLDLGAAPASLSIEPDWLRVAGEPNAAVGVLCAPGETAKVRSLSTWNEDAPPPPIWSLCTHVTWRLHGMHEGWNRFNESTGIWNDDWQAYPDAWTVTELA